MVDNPQFYFDLNEDDEEIREYFEYIHNKILNDREKWKQ